MQAYFSRFLFCLTLLCSGTVLAAGQWTPEGVDKESISPLMKAAFQGNMQAIKKCLSHGDAINERSASKMSALHYAIAFGHQEAAAYLLHRGAHINVLDVWGNTPLSMARERKLHDITILLENRFLSGGHLGKTFNDDDKHFVILVASFNNEAWYKNNLDSIFVQKYGKYTVIYMDDLSTDKTAQLVQEHIKRKRMNHKVVFIKNAKKKYCLGNYIFAINRFCPNGSIIVTLDGDDWFAHPHVLNELNSLYKDPAMWITYGESLTYPLRIKTPHCKPIPTHLFNGRGTLRNFLKKDTKHWPIHHLRSFYTWLFRKINHKDFLDTKGKLFSSIEDVAYMLPMIEMAGSMHHKYISKISYIYNWNNPLATIRTIDSKTRENTYLTICSKPPYSALADAEYPI